MLDTHQKTLAQSRLKPRLQNELDTSNEPFLTGAFPLYKKKIPTLIIGIIFSMGLIGLITTVYPAQIAHMFFKNSFLPLIITTFLSSFFLASYGFLNTRRGLFFSCWITTILWLQLIDALPIWVILPVLTIWFLGSEFLILSIQKS